MLLLQKGLKMNFIKSLFSYEGRIGRQEYFFKNLLVSVVYIVMIIGIQAIGFQGEVTSEPTAMVGEPYMVNDSGERVKTEEYIKFEKELSVYSEEMEEKGMFVLIFMIPIIIIFLYSAYSLAARRFHDLGKSGWYNLTLLIPIVSLFMAIYILFWKGQEEDNQYGENPLVKNESDTTEPTVEFKE